MHAVSTQITCHHFTQPTLDRNQRSDNSNPSASNTERIRLKLFTTITDANTGTGLKSFTVRTEEDRTSSKLDEEHNDHNKAGTRQRERCRSVRQSCRLPLKEVTVTDKWDTIKLTNIGMYMLHMCV